MIKALLVDDSPTALEMISTILSTDPEIEVIGKMTNGREAINFLDSHPLKPDIIITDLNMPVMNGFETAKAIRALNRSDAKSIPIVAMTADAFDEDAKRCLDAGMNAHIAKPIEPVKLFQTLLTYIR